MKPKTKRGQNRREKILRAAEKVFGTMGFADASITDITREADTAQGTLYIYFKGKEQIFSELVEEMGHHTREVIAQAISKSTSRLDAEKQGLRAFLHFVRERPELYTIVEEARFVDPVAYKSYFENFAKAYQTGLEAAQLAGEIRDSDNEVRAWALMGIAKALGEKYAVMDPSKDMDHIADVAFDLIENGLRR